MLKDYMRLKDFCKVTGIPISKMEQAVHGEYANQICRKMTPEARNSPYLIKTVMALKLWEGGYLK